MSYLTCEIGFRSYEMQETAIPVEIRKPNYALVGRGLTGQPVEVPPGRYIVTSRLPAGQNIIGSVDIGENESMLLRLEIDPSDRSPNESGELRHFMAQSTSPRTIEFYDMKTRRKVFLTDHNVRRVTFSTKVGQVRYGLRGKTDDGRNLTKFVGKDVWDALNLPLEGHTLRRESNVVGLRLTDSGHYQRPLKLNPQAVPDGKMFWIDLRDYDFFRTPPLALQLIQPGAFSINVRLPIYFDQEDGREYLSHKCQVFVVRSSAGYMLDIHPANVHADALMCYLSASKLEQAAIATKSDALSAQRLVFDKIVDPIGACIGAYALLRLGDIERFHGWTENLHNWFRYLPDGLIIHAEHLARLGDHDQALQLLLTVQTRGLPIFTDGLTYAIDRLRFYSSAKDMDTEGISRILDWLNNYAAVADFSKSLLTFTGVDPQFPDRRRSPARLDASNIYRLEL